MEAKEPLKKMPSTAAKATTAIARRLFGMGGGDVLKTPSLNSAYQQLAHQN